jgi:hypothetical protein
MADSQDTAQPRGRDPPVPWPIHDYYHDNSFTSSLTDVYRALQSACLLNIPETFPSSFAPIPLCASGFVRAGADEAIDEFNRLASWYRVHTVVDLREYFHPDPATGDLVHIIRGTGIEPGSLPIEDWNEELAEQRRRYEDGIPMYPDASKRS